MCKRVIIIILSIITITVAKLTIFLFDSPIQQIGTKIYRKELLTDKFASPKELAYDSTTRNLFFMYMDSDLMNSGRAFINIGTKEAVKIKGITNNKATAIDDDTSEVYFGSNDGLYKFDPLTNEASRIGLYNTNILKLIVKNNAMYVIDADNHMLYKVFDGGKKSVKIGNWDKVIEFHVDFESNIHFVSVSGLYCAIKGHELVKNEDLNEVYHFISDAAKVFGVTYGGLYEINCRNGSAKLVAKLHFFPSSITFGDYEDVFYSVDNSIYRLRSIDSYHVYNFRKTNPDAEYL